MERAWVTFITTVPVILFLGNYQLKGTSSVNFPLKAIFLLLLNKNSELTAFCISFCLFLAGRLEVKSLYPQALPCSNFHLLSPLFST